MIIDRYLIREVTRPFLATCLVLLAIFMAFGLARFLADANAGLLKIDEVVQLTALKGLISLEVLVPLSLYLGILIGLGRLHTDSEIYAMRAGGISERRTLRPIMQLAFILAVLIAGFSLSVRPWAYVQTYKIKHKAETSSEADRFKPARFYVFNKQHRTVYVQKISNDGTDLQDIFVRTRRGDDLQIITATTGKFEALKRPGSHCLTLKDARVFKGVQNGPDFFARFGTFTLWMPAEQARRVRETPESASTSSIRHASNPEERAEYQWRISTPVSTLLLALLAMPLSRSRPRAGRYARMLAALVTYALYFSLMDISRSWVQQDVTRTIWWVPGLLCLVVALLYMPWRRIRQARAEGRHA